VTSKERVLATVARRPLDRPCVDYEADADVSQALCEYLGLEEVEALRRVLGSDLRNLVDAAPYVGEGVPPLPDGTPRNYFGVPDSQGTYSSTIYQPPLANVETVAEVEAYPWPEADDFDYSKLGQMCDQLSEYALCGGAWSPLVCTAMHLTGMEEFFMLMAWKPQVAEAILARLCDLFYEYSKRYFEATAGKLDIFFMGDDYGLQNGPMFSVEMFRRLVLPHIRRLFELAKSYGLLVMMHSCGSIRAFIPDLIDAGMDILDPVQVRAAGMQIEGLKRDFGKDIVFHGSIDTQHTLPRGSVQDVEAEVRSRLELFAEEGGFICCGSQWYMNDIPLENLLAIYRTCGSLAV